VRALFDMPLDDISLEVLEHALHAATDEDGRWEAKSRDLRPEHVQRALAGFANRDGGLLVLGAKRAGRGWTLAALDPRRGDEPG
jgi:hypothetical protein